MSMCIPHKPIPLDWDGSPLTPNCGEESTYVYGEEDQVCETSIQANDPKLLSPEEIAKLKARYGTPEYHRYYKEWWEHYEKLKEKYSQPIECEDGTVILVNYL